MSHAETASMPRRRGPETGGKLIAAAAAEFNEHGYQGTDTNRIARRAGFAPQTFYRWFADKTEIFIRVYEDWQQQEAAMLRRLLAERAPDVRLAEACVDHHRAYLRFRRSLRQLAVENAQVRAARAASRLRQIEFLRGLGPSRRDPAQLAVTLLKLERLSDALAEGELVDMGLSPTAAVAALAEIIHQLRQQD